MNKQLKKFILCVKNIPQLRNVFMSCKSLEESYDRFKIMLNGCTLEEYKKFFEALVDEIALLSEEELMNVSGGVSLKRIMTPLAMMTVLMSVGPSMIFAADKDHISLTEHESASVQLEQQADTTSDERAQEDETQIDEGKSSQTQSDTTEGEIEFSSKVIESLPRRGEPNFDEFLKLPDQSRLKEKRVMNIEHTDGTEETKTINEKEVYKEIEGVVKQLIAKVESRTPSKDMSNKEIEQKIASGEISKHYKMPKEMRVAKAIYRWVIKNIKVDHESDTSGNGPAYRKPQDAISVYVNRAGVCQGYSRLLTLMMKMAGIPSAHITNVGLSHAFNLIYLEDAYQGRSGWTLLEPMWAAQIVQGDVNIPEWDAKTFFPAFYNTQSSLQEVNKSILRLRSHKIMDIATNTDVCGELELGDSYGYCFNIDDVYYNLFGVEKDALIAISGGSSNPSENVRIPEEISSLKIPFRFNWGIKSIILNGDEQLIGPDATAVAYDLEFIQFGNIKCDPYLDRPYIWCEMDTPAENVKIPETLVRLNRPIAIGGGIKSIILTGDETIDISSAGDLETIDATHSNKYVVEDGILYEKTAAGEKGNQIAKIGVYEGHL